MYKKKYSFSIPLYLQILLGMIAGIIIGIIALKLEGGRFVNHWVQPWGQVFIRLLQLIAVPLVFISLVKGVMGLQDISRFSKIGGRTILIYLCTTVVAVSIGLSLGVLIKPGNFFNREKAASMQKNYQTVVAQKKAEAAQVKDEGPLQFLNDIIPDNFVKAAGNNGKMLQVIFFAILFGIAALGIEKTKIVPIAELFDSLYDIILKMVDYIILFAPYGVAALMAGLVVDFAGDVSMFGALMVYAGTVILGMALLMLVFYPLLIHFFSKVKMKHFIKSMYPVQLLAFTTSSSAATLPVTMETVEKELGISNEVASFVLPVGTTINMDGTSCYQAIAVLFISQVIGIDLSFSQLLTIVFMTVVSSIGTPAIPGGSYVILTMVLSSVGIPAEGLALILGIDRPLDMLRTSVNVTGDATVSAMVER
ncbi:dicarboxylate/amino acid:cation symporter [Parabacteroides pacaensis]|uniref:dicarboxylate/amino acid:cation symporter n=1 Tax=Parabacteroides pacaensis TaxID=2086575 RepID=UPI000D1034FD|nr:dicarboxylate/amino acid:cation symporter [Parabacteroides pacaensis]